jgi:uncharacterized alkaline shock family protein YloU
MEWLRLLPKLGFFPQMAQTLDTRPGSVAACHRAAAWGPRAEGVKLAAVESEPLVVAETDLGRIAVTADAVAELVGRATAESYGVVGLTGRSRLARLFPRGIGKGVDVRRTDEGLVVEIRVVVEHGLRLAEVSAAVRERVSYELERMVGIPLASLEVHIEKVRAS